MTARTDARARTHARAGKIQRPAHAALADVREAAWLLGIRQAAQGSSLLLQPEGKQQGCKQQHPPAAHRRHAYATVRSFVGWRVASELVTSG